MSGGGKTVLACLAAALALPAPGMARVVRIMVDKTEPATAAPAPDGTTREVQAVTGRAFGTLDPAAPGNAVITDIGLAPRNADGMVEYVAKFTLTKPADMTWASGVLWYDLVNRGAPVPPNRGASSPLDDGHVRLISGWQGDLPPTDSNWTVQVPVARNADGSAITGPVLSRIADAKPGTATRPHRVQA